MEEHPVFFTGPMINAILAGRKTQTRRVMKPQPNAVHGGEPYWHIGGYRAWEYRETEDILRKGGNPLPCPYGKPGDRLWVREATYAKPLPNILTGEATDSIGAAYAADDEPVLDPKGFELAWWYSKAVCPSIHMPRWASRILLKVTSVRVERLQDISHDDAVAEGIEPKEFGFSVPGDSIVHGAREAYCALWDQINGTGSWAANPWVWCVSFRRVG